MIEFCTSPQPVGHPSGWEELAAYWHRHLKWRYPLKNDLEESSISPVDYTDPFISGLWNWEIIDSEACDE